MKTEIERILSQAFVHAHDNYGMPNSMEVAEYLVDHDIVVKKRAHRILVNNGSAVCSNCYHLDEIDPLANFCRYCGAEFEENEK